MTRLAAALVLVVAWWLLPRLGMPPFTSHMTSHMLVVVVASPLLAHALATSPCDPVRLAPRACSPIAASMLELVVVWAWHWPALHHAAQHHLWALVLEQGSFLGSGVYLWISALGGGPALRRERAPHSLLALLLTSTHMTLLGALIALSGRQLYAAHGDVGTLSALHDQQLGGAVMLVLGTLAYSCGGLWLTVDAFRLSREAE